MLLNLEKLTREFQIKISGVIHIGAHYGEEQDLYNRLGIFHKIYFEADPNNFYEMEQRMKPDNHWLVNKALGSKSGKLEMFCSDNNSGQSNSLLSPASIELQRYGFVYNKKRTVDMIRLDDYTKLSGNDLSPMNFINMDVEGYEMEVLKGATKTLKHVDYIICEVSSEERYVGQALEPEITDYLKKKGFDLIASDWGGVNWGDQLYARPGKYYIDKNSPLNIIR